MHCVTEKGHAGVVYFLHNGDYEPRYIGKTTQTLSARLSTHKTNARTGSRLTATYDWMRKHGVDNIQACVIATFTEDTIHLIDEVERFHIAQTRADIGKRCLNHADGGEGTPGYKPSAETRAKQSALQKKLAAGRVFTGWSDEQIEVFRAAAKNQWDAMSDEEKASQVARIHTPEAIAKRSGPRNKPNRPRKVQPTEEFRETMRQRAHTQWHTNRNTVNPDCTYCTV